MSYAGTDSHLHQAYISDGAWQDQDLTSITGGPPLEAPSSIANVEDTIYGIYRIDYAGNDSHIHEIYLANGAWHDQDLTVMASAPAVAAGSSISSIVDTIYNLYRVDYTGADSHLHEIYIWGSAWRDQDLTAMTRGTCSGRGFLDLQYCGHDLRPIPD